MLMLWLVVSAATAEGCSSMHYELGPHRYRRFSLLPTGTFIGDIMNYENLMMLGIRKDNALGIVYFGNNEFIEKPSMPTAKALFQHSVESFYLLDADSKFYNVTLPTNPLTFETMSVLELTEMKINKSWPLKIKVFVGNPDMTLFMYSDDKRFLTIFEKNSTREIKREHILHAAHYYFGQFFFFTGQKLESIMDDPSGKVSEIFLMNQTEGKSITHDAEGNVYLCHSGGIAYTDKYSVDNLAFSPHFHSCNSLIFYGRHAYVDDDNGFCKYYRMPPYTGKIEPSNGTDPNEVETEDGRDLFDTSTAAHLITGRPPYETYPFFWVSGTVSDFTTVTIMVGFFLLFFVAFLVLAARFRQTHKDRFPGAFTLGITHD